MVETAEEMWAVTPEIFQQSKNYLASAFAGALLLFVERNSMLTITLCLYFLCIASVFDVETHKIPNDISFPAILTGLITSIIRNQVDLILLIISVVILLIIGLFGLMGMGDIKLLIAISTFVGPQLMFFVLIYAEIMLVLYSFIVKKTSFAIAINSIKKRYISKNLKGGIPFAPFITASFVCVTINYAERMI